MRLTDADFARRSALTAVRSIKVPILILHGRQDDRAPVAQARAFLTKYLDLREPLPEP